METVLLVNIIWPALVSASVISLFNHILDGKKLSRNLFIFFGILGVISMILFFTKGPEINAYFNIENNDNYIFLQLYLFMFLLSISLVILALKKRIDAFTIIGIILMIVMLIILLRFTII